MLPCPGTGSNNNMKLDNDEMFGITAIILVLITIAFGIGIHRGSKCEQSNAIKAGVAHYVADEQGNSKFEYIKK